MDGENEIKKVIPSVMENLFAQQTDKLEPYVPEWVSPNRITAFGMVWGLLGAFGFYLAQYNRGFFILAVLGIIIHIVSDNVDGVVARRRNRCSLAGGYLDLISDITCTTAMLIALSLTGYTTWQIVIFLIPLYGISTVTSLHSAFLLKTFPFPVMGPFEIHLSFITIALINLIFQYPTFMLLGHAFFVTDILFAGGGIVLYTDMIRMGVQLFKTLNKAQREKSND